MKVMISLIGEQPAPNLLPIRYFHPNLAILVHTGRTQPTSERLKQLLSTEVRSWEVSPYEIDEIAGKLEQCIEQELRSANDVLFNLTGGTKPMSLAAFAVAQKLKAPVIYFQTE